MVLRMSVLILEWGEAGEGEEKGGSPFALSFSVLKKKRECSLGNCKLVVLSQS